MAKDTSNKSPVHSPLKLIQLLHRTAIASTILIISLTTFGTYVIYKNYVVDIAENAAISISESIVALEKHLLLHTSETQGSRLIIDESELDELNQTLKAFLIPYDILKIKIFSTDRIIIYSTDSSIIGQQDLGNQRLERALTGHNDAKMQTKQEVYDLADEKRFDVDVVESYIPIRNELNHIVGSFEVYQDMTKYREEIKNGVAASTGVITAILAVIFAIAYIMLRVAARQLEQTQNELHKLATVDFLTGVLNRSEIMRQANTEFSRYTRNRANKNNTCFSLIMSDIDHFKSVNDSYGHQMGDLILQQAAQRITSELREYSALGRYGGEEFMIILPDSNLETAKAVAERIRQAVKEVHIKIGKTNKPISISLGVATALDHETDFEQVLRRADQGLYLAKERGRDQVAWMEIAN